MTKTIKIIIALVILLLLVVAAYWYLFMRVPVTNQQSANNGQPSGFNPFGGTPSQPRQTNGGGQNGGDNNATGTSPAANNGINQGSIPSLRLLSNTPVGGYGSMTTGSTTVVRWIDRGRGNVYEAKGNSLDVSIISNNIVPMMYSSAWNKTLTSFIGSMIDSGSDDISTVYASLVPQAAPNAASTSTSADQVTAAPYQLKGKNFPSTVVSYAVSPKKDKVFLFSIENGRGIGYVAPFNGGSVTEIFDTPVTEVNVDWPEDNTIAITTKGSSSQAGFLYFVDPKSGIWKKVIGPLPGLSAKVNHDAKYALLSVAGNNNDVITSIFAISKRSGMDAVIRTIADKCAWGNFYKEVVYCGVPSQPVAGNYPDDWYKGMLGSIDKIWQVSAETGEVHLISSIVDQSDRVIDAFNLGLDDKDDYLFFMNKNDLSLWSLNLVTGN